MATRLTDADIGYLMDHYNRLRDEGWPAEQAAKQVDAIMLALIDGHGEETEGGQHERQHVANRRQR